MSDIENNGEITRDLISEYIDIARLRLSDMPKEEASKIIIGSCLSFLSAVIISAPSKELKDGLISQVKQLLSMVEEMPLI